VSSLCVWVLRVRALSLCVRSLTWHSCLWYESFHSQCYTPKNPPNRDAHISRCEFKSNQNINLNFCRVFRGIRVSGFGGFGGCSIFSGNSRIDEPLYINGYSMNEISQSSTHSLNNRWYQGAHRAQWYVWAHWLSRSSFNTCVCVCI